MSQPMPRDRNHDTADVPTYMVHLSPGQYAFALECLRDQNNYPVVDLSEIEDHKTRNLIRSALAIRKAMLDDLIKRMEDVPIKELEGQIGDIPIPPNPFTQHHHNGKE